MAKLTVLPRVHVMVICDAIEPSDEEDGVCHLFGVRTVIRADVFPHVSSELWIYLQVSGHSGTASAALLLVQASSDHILRRKSLPLVEFSGPLSIIPVQVRLRDCEFPEPGLYYIQITFEGKLLGERLLELVTSRELEP